jgi:hypothetical protein
MLCSAMLICFVEIAVLLYVIQNGFEYVVDAYLNYKWCLGIYVCMLTLKHYWYGFLVLYMQHFIFRPMIVG